MTCNVVLRTSSARMWGRFVQCWCGEFSSESRELFALTAPYRVADGVNARLFRTNRPIQHGLTQDDLRFRILRVLHLNRQVFPFIDPCDAEFRNIISIVAEWLDELYGDRVDLREEIKRDIGLFEDDPGFKLPKGYVLPGGA